VGLIVLAILTKSLRIHYLISNLFAICVIILWNYFMGTPHSLGESIKAKETKIDEGCG